MAAPPPAARTPVLSSPLALAAFRTLWIAATVSYVGTFVQDIGERWLMLDLTKSPLPAAMLSTALVTASLVAMLPAGVLADRMDRRSLVIFSQLAQATVATAIGLACVFHVVTPGVLLAGAAAAGLGMALGAPAWSALIADMVPVEQVADAVTLNAVAFNAARAVGPAIGGVILAASSVTVSFFANACSFVAVILAVVSSRPRERAPVSAPPPPVARAFVEPFIHVMRDARIRSVIVAMVLFSLGASFVYVLAPAFAKLTLDAGPRAYGLILGAMGLGAVLGGIVLKWLRSRMKPGALLCTLMMTYGLCSIALSQVHDVSIAIAVCIPAGVGWTGSFTSFSALVQVWTPNQLRARAMALYSVMHLGTWAIGASLSGVLAHSWSVRGTMLAGGAICIAAGFVTSKMPLPPHFTGAAADPT